PHRIVVLLEGEGLLNDGTALIIFRLAVASFAVGTLHAARVIPELLFIVVASLALGAVLAWAYTSATQRIRDIPSRIILQFVATFSVWLLADSLHLSGVLTIVSYAVVIERRTRLGSARIRVASYAVWDTGVYVLNVIAFVLMGLQVRPILGRLD